MLTASRLIVLMLMLSGPAVAQSGQSSGEQQQDIVDEAGENASNPLAKVRNTDLRWRRFELRDSSERDDYFIDGSFMATDELKIKYELHYWETDVTGRNEQDWESLSLKVIYFPKEGAWGAWKYRLAVGLEWILDFDNQDKGIGAGADIIAPFAGVALLPRPGTILVPLVQQFFSYEGDDVNTTGPRLIAIQNLPQDWWLKADVKAPIDWENDNAIPATAELQVGKHLNKRLSLYVDGLVGIGNDRPYDYGGGIGLRVKY